MIMANRYIKARLLQYQSKVVPNGNNDSSNIVLENIPDDYYIIDERKMPDGLFSYLGAFHYMREHARMLGFSDDKILIVHEIKNAYGSNGKFFGTMEVIGSLCDKTYCEFIKPYKEMGIPRFSYDKPNTCNDGDVE